MQPTSDDPPQRNKPHSASPDFVLHVRTVDSAVGLAVHQDRRLALRAMRHEGFSLATSMSSFLETIMPDRNQNHVGQFIAHDSEGTEYVIHIYQTTTRIDARAGSFDAPTGWLLRTANGRSVNWCSRGHYEIVGIPMIPLTSNDTNAFNPD